MNWITNYKKFILVNYEDEETTSIDDIEEYSGRIPPILFSSFDLEDDLEVTIQVSYDLDNGYYIIVTDDGEEVKNFSIEASLTDFASDLEASWQDLYEYFVGEARNRFYE